MKSREYFQLFKSSSHLTFLEEPIVFIGFRAEVDMVLFNFCKMAVLYSSYFSFLTWVLILHNSLKSQFQNFIDVRHKVVCCHS